RDGYLEFKRQLRELTLEFGGPVLLVHTVDDSRTNQPVLDRPLRDRQGKTVEALTRIAVPAGRLWTPISIGADGTAALGETAPRPAKRSRR
ncbi:MAG TPA: hypothetical protein VM512_00870, partial [Burkholderiaceae bacterium]|nr:hypothetical protein [Burkholderiaceae bacterium]